jgi:hypothetical protein
VHIAARVMAIAGPGQVAVTASVPTAVTGQTAAFETLGTHTLKGVPGVWELFRLSHGRSAGEARQGAEMGRSDTIETMPEEPASRHVVRLACGHETLEVVATGQPPTPVGDWFECTECGRRQRVAESFLVEP